MAEKKKMGRPRKPVSTEKVEKKPMGRRPALDDEQRESVSEAVKRCIEHYPGTRASFASKIGVSAAQLYQWSVGTTPVPLEFACEIEEIIGKNIKPKITVLLLYPNLPQRFRRK